MDNQSLVLGPVFYSHRVPYSKQIEKITCSKMRLGS